MNTRIKLAFVGILNTTRKYVFSLWTWNTSSSFGSAVRDNVGNNL